MGNERRNRLLHDKTHGTRPAGVAKVMAKHGSKYDLQLSDGRVIKRVGGLTGFEVAVGSFVTFNRRHSEYTILQVAPHGF